MAKQYDFAITLYRAECDPKHGARYFSTIFDGTNGYGRHAFTGTLSEAVLEGNRLACEAPGPCSIWIGMAKRGDRSAPGLKNLRPVYCDPTAVAQATNEVAS